MTELQRLYSEFRDGGHGHYYAIRQLAARLDVDQQTVRRVLERAARERPEGKYADWQRSDSAPLQTRPRPRPTRKGKR
ncbi:MAG TPA: hypothetical protein VGH82_17240 [Gaiellaceae bacterium]